MSLSLKNIEMPWETDPGFSVFVLNLEKIETMFYFSPYLPMVLGLWYMRKLKTKQYCSRGFCGVGLVPFYTFSGTLALKN